MHTSGIGKEIRTGHAVHAAQLLVVWMILVMIAGCGNDDRETGAASGGANREGISSVSHIDDIFTLEREVSAHRFNFYCLIIRIWMSIQMEIFSLPIK